MNFLLNKKDIAEILLQDYAGYNSEYNIFNTFLYQYINMDSENKYRKIWKKIIRLKLYHIDILGKIIKDNGIKPTFRVIECHSSKNIYYDLKMVKYLDDWKTIVEKNIELLIKKNEAYYTHVTILEDEEYKKIKSIINDNEGLIKYLKNIKNEQI